MSIHTPSQFILEKKSTSNTRKMIVGITGIITVSISTILTISTLEEVEADRDKFSPTSLKMSNGETASYMNTYFKSKEDPNYLGQYSSLDIQTLIKIIEGNATDVEIIQVIHTLEMKLKNSSDEVKKNEIITELKKIFYSNCKPASYIAAHVLARNGNSQTETPWGNLLIEYEKRNSASFLESVENTFYENTSIFRNNAGKPKGNFTRSSEKYVIAAECAIAQGK